MNISVGSIQVTSKFHFQNKKGHLSSERLPGFTRQDLRSFLCSVQQESFIAEAFNIKYKTMEKLIVIAAKATGHSAVEERYL